jgi:RecB family exonuclease
VGYVSEAVGSIEACLAHAERDASPRGERTRRRVARERGPLLAVARAIARLAGVRTVTAHVHRLQQTLHRLGFRPVGREMLDPEAAARDARAWQRFEELLAGLAGVSRALGSAPIGLEDFLAQVLTAAQLETASQPPVTGGVYALSVLDARGLDFDVVYLLGLDDGTFPAPRRESAVLPDAVKRALGVAAAPIVRARLGERATGLHGGLLRTAREASLEDPFLFFLALSMPERELVLSYPAADERGNATVRSPFLDEVEACLAGSLVPTTVDPAALVPEARACCAEAELVARAAADRWRAERPAPDRLTPALRTRLGGGAARLADIDRRARLEEARTRYFLTPLGSAARDAAADEWVGRVPASPALRTRLAALAWSPTRLEALAACGFKFYSARLLGLRERDEAVADVGGRERGTLLHRVLELLLRAMPTWPSDLAEARRRARAAVSGLRDDIEAVLPPKDRAVLDVEWQRVLAVVDELAALEVADEQAAAAAGCTREWWLEWPFEFAIESGDDDAALRVHGKADRVDLWRRGAAVERLRVRDYKTARHPGELRGRLDPPDPGEPRTAYQIALYLDAARRAAPALAVAGTFEGGYWAPLAAPRQRAYSRLFAADEMAAVERDLRALVDTARAGRFDVAPRVCDEWCPFRTVCRYQPPPVEDEGG